MGWSKDPGPSTGEEVPRFFVEGSSINLLGKSPGVAGAAYEHPLERVESNAVRTRGKSPPPYKKGIPQGTPF